MTNAPPVHLTIAFTDPDLNREEQEAEAQTLIRQMEDFEDVTLDLVPAPSSIGQQGHRGNFIWVADG